MTRPSGTPPRDYSLKAESPAGHLRNALQLCASLEAEWGDGSPLLADILAIHNRLTAALKLLERTP